MKKIISLLLVVTFITSLTSVVFAEGTNIQYDKNDSTLEKHDIIEVGPYSVLSSDKSDDILSKSGVDEMLENEDFDYDAILDQIQSYFNNQFQEYSEEQITEIDKLVQAAEIAMEEEGLFPKEIYGINSYSEDKAKLREGNYIELILDIDEGISASQATGCIALAQSAKSTAKLYYSNENYWDPAQHFIWAFNMTKGYNKATARTIGNNHEWGIVMIPMMENYFDEKYTEYVNQGNNSSQAASKALTATVAYIPQFKYISVHACQNSSQYFKALFTADCIMDFWNNCYGRAYPAKGYTSGIKAFKKSLNAGEIIVGPSSSHVTSTHFNNVREWDWYSY